MSSSPRKLVVETPGSRAAATPIRRAVSAEPPSALASVVHTPLDRSLHNIGALSSGRRGLSASARRVNAPTPHVQAANKILGQRRAAAVNTPGKKRQSLERRNSIFDIVKALGKRLAPASTLFESSPAIHESANEDEDDDDDDLPIDRPRLSLNLEADDDDDLQAPRSHGLEDENYTAHSIELPRRAASENPNDSRLRRESRLSDLLHGGDVTQTELGAELGYFPRQPLEDLGLDAGGNDATLER